MSIYCHFSEEDMNDMICRMSDRGWEYVSDEEGSVEFEWIGDDKELDNLKLKNWDEVDKFIATHEELGM